MVGYKGEGKRINKRFMKASHNLSPLLVHREAVSLASGVTGGGILEPSIPNFVVFVGAAPMDI